MNKFWAHLKTVLAHRRLVRRYCFRLGLYWQGLTHDLSKFSPMEFWRGVRYFQGFRSPNDEERACTGVSLAWLHHKGRNRHHFEYWIDYCRLPDGSFTMDGCRMPAKYVAEMFCDRVAASRVYRKEAYTDASPYEYFARSRDHILIHPDTARELEFMLRLLAERGEDAAFAEIRRRLADSTALTDGESDRIGEEGPVVPGKTTAGEVAADAAAYD